LAEKYKKWKEAGANFEIVFISSDRDQKSFDEYYSEMPWLALDFSNRDLKVSIKNLFSCTPYL
jgi:nucleoredoxin